MRSELVLDYLASSALDFTSFCCTLDLAFVIMFNYSVAFFLLSLLLVPSEQKIDCGYS
jgi:hypothetical protein